MCETPSLRLESRPLPPTPTPISTCICEMIITSKVGSSYLIRLKYPNKPQLKLN